ncbi:Deoxyribonuclease-1 [Galemys pyrenaicus]|uniref:Deoxyribonuclease-1 n=1 Tax=Galemys pyrenaicus TaxID=202257 RepID=A0A8J5ZSX4_GALPY|nr:Deoxyribonuclease-1 [Galemys pyrenaicus]
MLMGDFNAGCSYVRPAQWASIRLRTHPAFLWLIPDSADTTVTPSHCPYDRCAGRPRVQPSAPVWSERQHTGQSLRSARGYGRAQAQLEWGWGAWVGTPGPTSLIWCCRIVVAGAQLQDAVVPHSAGPFDFQAAYGLSSQLVGGRREQGLHPGSPRSDRAGTAGPGLRLPRVSLQALAISDHYPVEVTLR